MGALKKVQQSYHGGDENLPFSGLKMQYLSRYLGFIFVLNMKQLCRPICCCSTERITFAYVLHLRSLRKCVKGLGQKLDG